MDLWNELDKIAETEAILEEYMRDPGHLLMEMANVVGRYTDFEIPFSFYFSSKNAVHGRHGPRVKIKWNEERMTPDADGYIELHGSFRYTHSDKKKKPKGWELDSAKYFCKVYKVLFLAVWDNFLPEGELTAYFYNKINFNELLRQFNVDEETRKELLKCKDIKELEVFVRNTQLFNLYE